MANKQHLEILQRGPDAWDKWRAENNDEKPDLSNANLNELDSIGINFVEADLRGANLTSAKLMFANFKRANLSGARLYKADLVATYMGGANLSDTYLRKADLVAANLSSADLSNTDMTNALIGSTTFQDNDLSMVKGLAAVEHLSPSYISIDTIYKSKGDISEVFLRGAGVPDNFIAYMTSLTDNAFSYYKCFISFTESDDMFSERLYNDLQAAGVRCWRWKEDAKWGKTLMRSIDEAIHLYDKLIVICSKQSLNSPAVIREIERALQKEDELMRNGIEGEVLFPIRLDDYVLSGWLHHRKADVLAKNIGDFRQWKNSTFYRKGLQRLMRNLQLSDVAEGRT